MNRHLLLLLAAACLTTFAHAQTADPKPLVEKALTAVGGKDKLLKIFRFQEIFHFGDQPEPPAGKKRSTRESVYSQPDQWWLGQKERGDEPAKDDVLAWSLDLLVDDQSKRSLVPGSMSVKHQSITSIWSHFAWDATEAAEPRLERLESRRV